MKKIFLNVSIIATIIAVALILMSSKVYAEPDTNPDQPSFKVEYDFKDDVNMSQSDKEKFKADIRLDVEFGGSIVQSLDFPIGYGEQINLMTEEVQWGAGATYTLSLNEINVDNWKLTVNGTDIGKNPYVFNYNPTTFESINAKFEIEPNTDLSVNINNINTDGDLYPNYSEQIKNGEMHKQTVHVYNIMNGKNKELKLNYGQSVNLIQEYPELFNINDKCVIQVDNSSVIEMENIEYTGNNLDTDSYPNTTIIDIAADTQVDMNIYSKIMGSILNFEVQYMDEDEDGMSHAPEYQYFVLDLTSLSGNIDYFRLIEDNDGNLTYVYSESKTSDNEESIYETPNGATNFLKVNTGKYTKVILPYGVGGHWSYIAGNDFQQGTLHGYGTSYPGSLVGANKSYAVHTVYSNKYDVKTVTKTDVEGNPTDATFELIYDDYNQNETSDLQKRKFVFKHYDSKEIKGVLYENVYEVVGSTTLEDENSDSVVSTKDGKYTIYYPQYYLNYEKEGFYKRYKNPSTNAYLVDKLYISEKSAADGYVVNENDEIIELADDNTVVFSPYFTNLTYAEDYNGDYEWNKSEIIESINNVLGQSINNEEQNNTIINKKKPTLVKVIDETLNYDGEFIFKIYEKETNTLVATITSKANKIVTLEPLTINEAEVQTGYLEDGKTYIIREEPVQNFENEKIEGKHGTVGEDEISKYFEFTFDGTLSKLQDVVFYNKYIEPVEVSEEDPATEETPVVEEKQEEIKQVQTGDMLSRAVVVLAIAVTIFGVTYVIKKEHNV